MTNEEINSTNLPKHIAFIVDGNGRWAQQRGKKRTYGHQVGIDTLEKIVNKSFEIGIAYVSLYVFSVDNWKREKEEVNFLMKLIKNFYKKSFPKIKKKGIRVVHSGIHPPLSKETLEILKKVDEETIGNKNGTMNLCINYGGRVEIVEGIKKLYQDIENKILSIDDLDVKNFSNYLFHPDIPDVDLLIRTSGEYRISDFLLWRMSYAELWFTDTLWPDFNEEELFQAIKSYQERDRRFGGIKK